MQKISKLIATLLFIGYIPFLPGTAGSILAIPLYLLVKGNISVYIGVTLFLLILGFWSSNRACKEFSRIDPPQIVIDEFASLLLVYLFVPFSVKALVIGFLLFRVLDIIKLPFIKKLETLPGGYGIMLDDIAVALLANMILQVLHHLTII